ncbi:tetraspanin-8-like [Gouania willdenowi]|uniref:Tetraspanin n=1 Tax=Gouania willdenowi TaxID=441366 RepID=A0A8C5FXY2_GOUWI|nr:tetraspanin-8 [Gouania willdenowi]
MAVNKCIKYLLFAFNLLFWISGCVILGVSIYLKVSKRHQLNGAIPGVDLLIAIGVIIMVLGFLGCCGAIRESRCLLLLFFVALLLIFILLMAAGIVGAVGESKVKTWLKEKLEELVPLSDQPQNVRDDVESLQRELKCCGIVNGPTDWGTVPPASCKCNATDSSCTAGVIFVEPCGDKLITMMESNLLIVVGIAFGIACLLIFGMVFSMILYCQITRSESGTNNTA